MSTTSSSSSAPMTTSCTSPTSHHDPPTPSSSSSTLTPPDEPPSNTIVSLPPDVQVDIDLEEDEDEDDSYPGSQEHIDDLNNLPPASRVWILLHGVAPHVLPTYRGRRKRMQRLYGYGCGSGSGYGHGGGVHKPRRGSRLKFMTSPCVNKSLGDDWLPRAPPLRPSRTTSKSSFFGSIRPSPYPSPSTTSLSLMNASSSKRVESDFAMDFDCDQASLYCGSSDHGMGLFGLHNPLSSPSAGLPQFPEASTSKSTSSSSLCSLPAISALPPTTTCSLSTPPPFLCTRSAAALPAPESLLSPSSISLSTPAVSSPLQSTPRCPERHLATSGVRPYEWSSASACPKSISACPTPTNACATSTNVGSKCQSSAQETSLFAKLLGEYLEGWRMSSSNEDEGARRSDSAVHEVMLV